MATKIMRPLAEGFYTQWPTLVGATKVAAVDSGDPVAHDDETSYIKKNETAGKNSFTLQPASGVGVINSVSLGSRARIEGLVAGNSMNDGLRLGGNDSGVNTYALANTNYATMGATSAARPGGGTWTAGDLSTLEMYIQSSAGGATSFRCTTLWISLDYIPATGGWAFMLGLAGLAALQNVGTLIDFSQFKNFLSWRKTAVPDDQLGAGEDVIAWREFSEYRFPKFFNMGGIQCPA